MDFLTHNLTECIINQDPNIAHVLMRTNKTMLRWIKENKKLMNMIARVNLQKLFQKLDDQILRILNPYYVGNGPDGIGMLPVGPQEILTFTLFKHHTSYVEYRTSNGQNFVIPLIKFYSQLSNNPSKQDALKQCYECYDKINRLLTHITGTQSVDQKKKLDLMNDFINVCDKKDTYWNRICVLAKRCYNFMNMPMLKYTIAGGLYGSGLFMVYISNDKNCATGVALASMGISYFLIPY